MRMTNPVCNRLRHRDAWSSADATPVEGFGGLRGQDYALLTTYRKDGTAVPCPVWFGLDDAGRLYFNTEAVAAKVRRIQNNPRVRVAPCDIRGKPIGPPAEGIARVFPSEESARAEQVVAANYGRGRKIYEGLAHRMNVHNVYVEVVAG